MIGIKNKYIINFFALLLVTFSFGTAKAKFADVDITHPYYHAINSLQTTGIVEGYLEENGKRSFRPLQAVSRAEATKMILLSAGQEIRKSREIFPDVVRSNWFFDAVGTAHDAGLVKGFTDGLFHPQAQVTRSEMLKITLLSFGQPEENFTPTENQQWFTPYLNFAEKMSIIDEDSSPHKSINRGEVAEILYRTQKVAKKKFLEAYNYSGSGQASYYHDSLAGNPTASGDAYDPEKLTAAHRTLPLGTKIKISHGEKFVVVEINDRGPYHGNRILDLSRKAFSLLAPIGAGVIDVDFEVYTSPKDQAIEVPNYVRENLSEKSQKPIVPAEVATLVNKLRGKIISNQIPSLAEKKNLISKPQLLFPGTTVPFLTKDFFKKVELREHFPRKYLQGSVINFTGRATERGHKKATFFLQELIDDKKGEQFYYSGDISGLNFAFPVILERSGTFMIGVVLDDEKKSRTETIEVISKKDHRKFASSKDVFLNNFAVRVVPEEKTVFFDFIDNQPNDIQKITFVQRGLKEKTLYIYDGIKTLGIPYNFFADFTEFRNLAVDLFAAKSEDGKLENQTTAWQKTAYNNFQVTESFPDKETKKVSIQNFTRYHKKLEKVSFSGKVLDKKTKLKPQVFITLPTGKVYKEKMNISGDIFSFSFMARSWGRYIVEILSDQGEILFNRAIYFSDKMVLPVYPSQEITLTNQNVAGIRYWINQIRTEANKNSLIADYKLNNIAQKYADQMATKNFIGHTSPQGKTFADRIYKANLKGEFGENLSFGSTIELALSGLKDSGSHYQNMVSFRWKKVGIGIAKNKKGWYIVNIFGR